MWGVGRGSLQVQVGIPVPFQVQVERGDPPGRPLNLVDPGARPAPPDPTGESSPGLAPITRLSHDDSDLVLTCYLVKDLGGDSAGQSSFGTRRSFEGGAEFSLEWPFGLMPLPSAAPAQRIVPGDAEAPNHPETLIRFPITREGGEVGRAGRPGRVGALSFEGAVVGFSAMIPCMPGPTAGSRVVPGVEACSDATPSGHFCLYSGLRPHCRAAVARATMGQEAPNFYVQPRHSTLERCSRGLREFPCRSGKLVRNCCSASGCTPSWHYGGGLCDCPFTCCSLRIAWYCSDSSLHCTLCVGRSWGGGHMQGGRGTPQHHTIPHGMAAHHTV